MASPCGIRAQSPRHRYFTPAALLDLVDATLGAGRWFDPAGDPLSGAWARACGAYDIRVGECGLTLPWPRVPAFANPPFSQAEDWASKCARHAAAGFPSLYLGPCQPGSLYWRAVIWRFCDAVCFVGRPKFGHLVETDDSDRGLKAGSITETQHPTDIAVVGFGVGRAKMIEVWSRAGVVVAPIDAPASAFDMSVRPC